MLQARVHRGWIITALVSLLFPAADTDRADSLQDAWNAALAVNQRWRASQTGTAAAPNRERVVNNTEVLDAETLRLQTYTDSYNAYYAVLQDQFRLCRSLGQL